MAAGYLSQLSGGQIEVRSAGSEPADKINPIAVEAMAEEGIDIAAERPKILTTEAVKASDVVITMGCATPAPTTIPANATRTGSSTTPQARISTMSGPSATRSAVASNPSSTNSYPHKRNDHSCAWFGGGRPGTDRSRATRMA
jgi:protein-tyrosine-phosphatase